jgi:glycosyltransferase involved in cell wall biosynthesis
MRIAIVMSGAFGGAGVPRVVESWARMLGEAGHAVTVVSRAEPKATPFPALPGVRARLVEIDAGAPRRKRLFLEARAVAGMLDGLRRDEGLDLVVSHSSPLSVELRKSFPAMPIVQTIHSPAVHEHHLTNWLYADSPAKRLTYPLTRSMLWYFERRALQSVSAVHTLSRYCWELIGALYPRLASATAWQRIPGTYDHQRFIPPQDREGVRRELGIRPDETMLLTVRRLVPRTGVDRILHAARALRRHEGRLRFLVGGTGALREQLERAVRDGGLGRLVEFLGFVPEERLAGYYQAADAFLMPTRRLECFGLPVIEAMGCGCPPLVMPDGGPAEICRKFPERIAEANTDEAFTGLVRRFIEGEIPRRIDGVEGWARERYAEDAVRPAIEELVVRFGVGGG